MSIRRPGLCALAVSVLALVGGEEPARAGDTPRVRIILPRSAMTNASADATTTDVVLDQQLPAGQDFFLEMPIAGKESEVYASVELWPKPSTGECKDPTPNIEQHYRFGMQIFKENDESLLRAKVPKLQIGTGYCIRVTGRTSIPDSTASGAASEASVVVEKRAVSGDCIEAITQESFDSALAEGLRAYKYKSDATAAARKARTDFDKDNRGREKCEALEKAKTTRRDAEAASIAAEKDLAAQIAKIREVDEKGRPSDTPTLPPLMVRAPMVRIFNENYLASEALDDQKLDAAVRYLGVRIAQNETDFLKNWRDKLVTLGRVDALGRFKLAERDTLFTSAPDHPFELWTGTAYVSMRQFKANLRLDAGGAVVSEVAIDAALKQITFRMKDRWTEGGKENQLVVKWIGALQTLVSRVDAVRDKHEARDKALKAFDTERVSFRTAVRSAFDTKDARAELTVSVGLGVQTEKAGAGQTAAATNYASVDLGAAFAAPSGGTRFDPWLVPYVGLNIYFAPVEREIPLEEIHGNRWDKFLQRFSVTVGMTLSQPKISGRELKPFFLGSSNPLVAALGLRLTPYSRLTMGAMIYSLADPNPASTGTSIYAAPFLGYSLDADVVHLVGKVL